MGMSTDVMVTVSVAFMLCVTISVCYEQKDEITVWDEVLPIKEEVLFDKDSGIPSKTQSIPLSSLLADVFCRMCDFLPNNDQKMICKRQRCIYVGNAKR